MNKTTFVIVSSMAAVLLSPATASELGANLVVNGDAEIGSMEGWTPTDDAEVVETTYCGYDGLPSESVIRQFRFYGGGGPEVQACSQSTSTLMLK